MRAGDLGSDVGDSERSVARGLNWVGFAVLFGGVLGILAALFYGGGGTLNSLQVPIVILLCTMFSIYGLVLISQSDAVRIAELIAPQLAQLQSKAGASTLPVTETSPWSGLAANPNDHGID